MLSNEKIMPQIRSMHSQYVNTAVHISVNTYNKICNHANVDVLNKLQKRLIGIKSYFQQCKT